MASTLEFDLAPVAEFVQSRIPGVALSERMAGIGLRRDGVLVAGALFEGISAHNAWVHLAGEPGARWMTREYLRACFAYPFLVCGVRRLSGWVDASNAAARRLNEHFGYQVEATLKGAAADGGDVLIYVMWRDQCRFIDRGPHEISHHRI